MPATDTITIPRPTPYIGRQLRLEQTEYDALRKAARRGKQNAYIVAALRAQLKRDGHLKTPKRARRRRASR